MSSLGKWIVESTIDYDYDSNTKIRVWRSETEARASYDNSVLLDLIKACRSKLLTAQQAACMIAAADRVAAVQVIYHSRIGGLPDEGFVIYTDWP